MNKQDFVKFPGYSTHGRSGVNSAVLHGLGLNESWVALARLAPIDMSRSVVALTQNISAFRLPKSHLALIDDAGGPASVYVVVNEEVDTVTIFPYVLGNGYEKPLQDLGTELARRCAKSEPNWKDAPHIYMTGPALYAPHCEVVFDHLNDLMAEGHDLKLTPMLQAPYLRVAVK